MEPHNRNKIATIHKYRFTQIIFIYSEASCINMNSTGTALMCLSLPSILLLALSAYYCRFFIIAIVVVAVLPPQIYVCRALTHSLTHSLQ